MTAAHALNYGKGEYTLPLDTVDIAAEQDRLETWLEGFLARPGVDLPRPPAVALEILSLSRRPTARIEELAALLEREPLLAGRVLRLANSALYGSATPCVTLKQALIRMGLSLVRDVVMEAAMQMTVIHADGFNRTLESIRRHSSAVAWISRFVARHTPLEAENAFMLGLLHDVGLSFSLIGVAEYFKKQRQPPRLSPECWLAVETQHERFSEAVLKSWGMPPSVTLVAQHHHSLMLGGLPHPQVAVLIVAEQIACDAGWGIYPVVETSEDSIALVSAGERSLMAETDRALQALSLTRRHFDTISADMTRLLETLDGQFQKK
ncbi:MAG: HDOD domain-containing protein [Archangium sp.]|nr:HDOD domain-containing protein [Archangium sp.]